MERVKSLSSNVSQHPVFFEFVDSVFRGGRAETWTAWRDRGGWTANYEVFAIVDDGSIVGTIGRSRMHLVIEGENRVGYQLGAVATLERHRGQGIARQLMEWVIDSLDQADQPVILFANNSVLDFYPRFGFKRLPQQRSVAAAALYPAGRAGPAMRPVERFGPGTFGCPVRESAADPRAPDCPGLLLARSVELDV